jgi:ABC-type phosphate transport system substrate-binding protein
MRAISKKGIAAAASCALAFGLMTVGGTAAHADVAPGASDIVGVGSDTLQYMLGFGADGDLSGDSGYNTGKLNRIFSFDATPDANARSGFLNGSIATLSGTKPLNPTIVLRAGGRPVQRPNGSGAGLTALDADTGNKINFVRSSSPLTQASTASQVGALHEVRLAHEILSMATATTTNAVPLSKTQLLAIYQCTGGTGTGGQFKWTDVGGTSSNLIIPIVPQPGSGTRKTFLSDIGFTVNSDGTTSPALGGCVKNFEENDPYALYVDSSGSQITDPYATTAVASPDAIEPMSGARLALYQSGYFFNPNVALGKAVPTGDQGVLSPGITTVTTGTPSSGGAVYTDERGLYVFFRDADVTSGSHFNGSARNWVNTLFLSSTTTPFFASGAGQALLSAAGVTPDYADCGVNPTDTSGCGPFGP